jgi:hypothetical protein
MSFAAITLGLASQQVFLVTDISLTTQSGNFWIHTRTIPYVIASLISVLKLGLMEN